MKIKTDFVTNSSSTSFIIPITTDLNDRLDLLKKLNAYFEQRYGEDVYSEELDSPPQIDINSLQQKSENVFVLEGVVPYYKGYDDLPEHIRDLVLDYKSNPSRLSAFGIKKLELQIIDKNVESK
jgi:hypothetical protein